MCDAERDPVRAKKTLTWTRSRVSQELPASPSSMLLRDVWCQIAGRIVNIEEGGAGGSCDSRDLVQVSVFSPAPDPSLRRMAASPIRGRVFRKHKEEWYPTGVDSVQKERPDCEHGW